MRFSPSLQTAILQRRYKRFLADIITPDGREFTIHCPNTGSMMNCQDPGSRVWYSVSGNLARKYPFTWELVQTRQGDMVGINTARANQLVIEALANRCIGELGGYAKYETEVPYGTERSRIDLLLSAAGDRQDCYVEVKNVSLAVDAGVGLFPDAVSLRGQKHLRELIKVRQSGARAVLLFCVQHSGVRQVRPADHIDPHYGVLLRQAWASGVELLAYGAEMDASGIRLCHPLAVNL